MKGNVNQKQLPRCFRFETEDEKIVLEHMPEWFKKLRDIYIEELKEKSIS